MGLLDAAIREGIELAASSASGKELLAAAGRFSEQFSTEAGLPIIGARPRMIDLAAAAKALNATSIEHEDWTRTNALIKRASSILRTVRVSTTVLPENMKRSIMIREPEYQALLKDRQGMSRMLDEFKVRVKNAYYWEDMK